MLMVQHTLSMVHQKQRRSREATPFLFLMRVRGNAGPLQDAGERLVGTLSVHLAPERSGGGSSPLARTKNREGVAGRLLLCF